MIRDGESRITSVEPGDALVFGYRSDRRERRSMPDQDLLPVLIVTHMYSSRIYGVNINGLPDRRARLAVIDRLRRAGEAGSDRERLRVLYDLRRLVSGTDSYKPAFVSYRWRNVRTRVARLETSDLEELTRRIL